MLRLLATWPYWAPFASEATMKGFTVLARVINPNNKEKFGPLPHDGGQKDYLEYSRFLKIFPSTIILCYLKSMENCNLIQARLLMAQIFLE